MSQEREDHIVEVNKKAVLHLNLKRKWFDMILSGEKNEEYRAMSPYWHRIFGTYIKIKGLNYHPSDVIICFSNGYSKDRGQFFIDCLGMHVGCGKREWGATPREQYFVLRLGDIVKPKSLSASGMEKLKKNKK